MENNLVQIINGKLLISSRDVAELVEKRHADLLRDIDHYVEIINQNAKLRFDDFFVETSYTAGTGKNYKAYFLTKKGCDMVANKMTGEKGILFTATYIDRFYKMEAKLKEKAAIPANDLKAERLAVMKRNAKVREATLWAKLAQDGNETFKQVCRTYAANILAEKEVVALPEATEKTYTATEIGKILGVSANKVGRLATAHNLKTKKYGKWFHDKSRHSSKEVETFRYYECAIDEFKSILKAGDDIVA